MSAESRAAYIYSCWNKHNSKVYIGKTFDLKRRISSHLFQVRNGSTLPFHNAIRKYGEESFEWKIDIITNENEVDEIEKIIISSFKGDQCYNIAEGGQGGFVVLDREEWKRKLSESRKGRKPALGLKHSDKNKELFSKLSKEWWRDNRKYNPDEIKGMTFKEARDKFGISKTHYYRLKKA